MAGSSVHRIGGLLLIAATLFFRHSSTKSPTAHDTSVSHVKTPVLQQTAALPPDVATPARSHPALEGHGRSISRQAGGYKRDGKSAGFVPLPGFDPNLPTGKLMIVRMELPGEALALVGLPAGETNSDHRILADVLVDEDGTPYAVRLAR